MSLSDQDSEFFEQVDRELGKDKLPIYDKKDYFKEVQKTADKLVKTFISVPKQHERYDVKFDMDIQKNTVKDGDDPNESAFDHILRAIKAKEEQKKIQKVRDKEKIFSLKETDSAVFKSKQKKMEPGLKKSTKK